MIREVWDMEPTLFGLQSEVCMLSTPELRQGFYDMVFLLAAF